MTLDDKKDVIMTKQSKGVVQSEAKDHVLKITINIAKKNAFDLT